MSAQFFKKNKESVPLPPEQPVERAPVATPEVKPLDETLSAQERQELKEEVLREIEGRPKPAPAPVAPAPITIPKSETLVQVETILEEDLGDLYFQMEPELQEAFKSKGEEISKKIEVILEKASFKAKEIFRLIVEWLKLIPGANKFFIRQEAKIKTDKIIKIKSQ